MRELFLKGKTMRRGFTLIELLMVIVIIGVLVGLLLPVMASAVRRANEAAITSEINTMSQALAGYASKVGDYPPSRIVLSETGDYSAVTLGPTMSPLAVRSMIAIRKLAPRVILSASGPVQNIPGGFYDFNGDGVVSPPIMIQGHECLVYFLGGLPTGGNGIWSTTGFAKSPGNPFQAVAAALNRYSPMYDFSGSKLVDIDKNGFPECLDRYGKPYAYFSAYGGMGYDADDINMSEAANLSDPNTLGAFQIFGGTTLEGSPSPNPYTVGLSAPATGYVSWQRAQTFQIISAGNDGYFGPGGQYVGTTIPTTPFSAATTALVTGQTLLDSIRVDRESDNMSNFTTGHLGSQ